MQKEQMSKSSSPKSTPCIKLIEANADIMQAAMSVAKQLKYCQRGDSVVAVHRIGHSAVIKISEVK